jgi:hypothetical protein
LHTGERTYGISRLAVLALGSAMLASGAAAESIKVATWNMTYLHHVPGEPLRDRAPARSEEDYELLRKYRDRLGADVIALQEVNGPKAGLVFPPDEYDLYFSARYIDDLVTGKAMHADPEQRSDRIYTGFAIRRGVFDAVSKRDVPSLGVIHAADGRLVRWGTEIMLEKNGQLLQLLEEGMRPISWAGTGHRTPEFQKLAQAIRKKIGGRGDVSTAPTSLVVVVGDPETYRGVGPVLNLTCEFSNESYRSVVIRRLDLEGKGPGEKEYHLRWHPSLRH